MAERPANPPIPKFEISMTKFKPKQKHPKAPWVGAFKRQARALRPENAGQGVRSRSGGEKARMAVYNAIKAEFLIGEEECVVGMPGCTPYQVDIHHKNGRSGILLFDVRHWMTVCNSCHSYLHAHPAEARIKGWLAQSGEWNKEAE